MSGVKPCLLSLVCLLLSGSEVHSQAGRAEQCKKPSLRNLEKVSVDKEHYNWGEEVTLQCKSGHYPSSERIRCMKIGARSEWRPHTVCIEVRVTSMEVTSTRIRLSIVCSPDQCENSWTSYVSSCIKQKDFYNECKYGTGEKTFSSLEPLAQYEIVISHSFDRSPLTLKSLHIKTAETDLTDPVNPTETSPRTLAVAPVLGIIAPIFTVKLLILIVLLMILITQMARKSSQTDLNRNKQPRQNSIPYRKEGREYVNMDEVTDCSQCEDPHDAAHS